MNTRTRNFDSAAYWDRRYVEGGDSGAGSQGDAALRKARVINTLIADYHLDSVIDWGVGDGEVLASITNDVGYTGVDISRVVLDQLAYRFPHRRLLHLDDVAKNFDLVDLEAGMAMSLDVIFHQVDDRDYEQHLRQLFGSARRLVLVHATDHDGGRTAPHVRWRRWTPDIPAGWQLTGRPGDSTVPGFYLCKWTP